VARLSTRSKTHTLDLTRIKPSLLRSSVLSSEWLRNLFDGLPNVQSFLVHALSDFDTGSLRVLRGFNLPARCNPDQRPIYDLRLLTASTIRNAVSSSLECALQCFPHLIYLDLSSTRAANNTSVLQQIGSITKVPALEVLKLRNIGLGDAGLIKLATGLGIRVWSLDLRQNLLTDTAVLILLKFCFLRPDFASPPSSHKDQMDYINGLGPEDNESSVLHRLAGSPKSGCLRRYWTGLTHLYISDNTNITIRSLCPLIKAWRLIALDWGKLKSLPEYPLALQDFAAARLLLDTLEAEMKAGARLHYLRVDHLLVTREYAALDAGIHLQSTMDHWPGWSEDVTQGTLFCENKLPGLGLHTLVLTDLPSRSARGWLTKGLLAFLYKCASEERANADDPQVIDVAGYPATNLRELHLELRKTSETDPLNSDFASLTFQDALEHDFSFFRDRPSRGTSSRHPSATRKQVNPYEGDIVQALQKFRVHFPWKWSGKLVVVPTPQHTKRQDPIHDPDRAIII